jgi:hypothetical protein
MNHYVNRFVSFILLAVVANVLSGAAIAQADTLFTRTGSLTTTRYMHTATRLPNGRVLVAGGYNTNTATPLITTEIYNPLTGTFSPGPNMLAARYSHTATLLANGTVLMVGGQTVNNAVLARAEVYDPQTNAFTASGSLALARVGHTATLLNTGAVLIVGGFTLSGTTATAELYNPTRAAFASAGSALSPHGGHTATLLRDGSVLITGGDFTDFRSAELYLSGTFVAVGRMNSGRLYHTATLLNTGNVLLIGGSSPSADNAGAEIFDPTTRAFTVTGSPLFTRAQHTAELLPSGLVFVVGTNGVADGVCELFDPSHGTFYGVSGMFDPRYFTTATVLGDGRVLIAAGSGEALLSRAELFTPPDLATSPAPVVDAGGSRTVALDQFGGGDAVLSGTAGSPAGLTLSTVWWSDNVVQGFGNTLSISPLGFDWLGVSVYTFRATDTRGVFADSTITFSVQLPAGGAGTVGPAGPQGLQGVAGPQGVAGATGAQGAQGDKGDVGLQGLKGEDGAQGPKGDKGDAGAIGPQGDKGDTGAQGSKGDKGDAGAQGP